MRATLSGVRWAESRRNSSARIRPGAPLSVDELREPGDRVEILRHDLLVADRKAERFLHKGDQLQDAGRVDDSPLREGVVRRERRVPVAEQEILQNELPQNLRGTGHYATSSFWMNCLYQSWVVTAPIS